MTTYHGKRNPKTGETKVTYQSANGRAKPLRHVNYHSPDGFEWGYGGSGPADLALSILAYQFGETWVSGNYLRRLKRTAAAPLCWQLHQDFKAEVISRLDRDEWEMTSADINGWLLSSMQAKATTAQTYQQSFEYLCRLFSDGEPPAVITAQAKACYLIDPSQGSLLLNVLNYWKMPLEGIPGPWKYAELETDWLEGMIAEKEPRARYTAFREQLKTALNLPDTDVNTWDELTEEQQTTFTEKYHQVLESMKNPEVAAFFGALHIPAIEATE